VEVRESTARFFPLPSSPVKFTIIACGGFGANVILHMIHTLHIGRHPHLKLAVCESNWNVLKDHFVVEEDSGNADSVKLFQWFRSEQLKIFPLGTDGFGAGGDPEMGGKMLAKKMDELEEFIAGTTIALLIGGGGGGTSGIMPILATYLKEKGIPAFSILTLPRFNEGGKRIERSRGIEKKLLDIHPTLFPNNEKIQPSENSGEDVYWEINNLCIFPNIEFLRSLIEDVGNVTDIDLRDLIHAFSIGNRVLLGTFDASHGMGEMEKALFENKYFDNSILAEARLILWWYNGKWSTEERDAILNCVRKKMDKSRDEEVEIKSGIRQKSDEGPKTVSFFAFAPTIPSFLTTGSEEKAQTQTADARSFSPTLPESETNVVSISAAASAHVIGPTQPSEERHDLVPISGEVNGFKRELLGTPELKLGWAWMNRTSITRSDLPRANSILEGIAAINGGVKFDYHGWPELAGGGAASGK